MDAQQLMPRAVPIRNPKSVGRVVSRPGRRAAARLTSVLLPAARHTTQRDGCSFTLDGRDRCSRLLEDWNIKYSNAIAASTSTTAFLAVATTCDSWADIALLHTGCRVNSGVGAPSGVLTRVKENRECGPRQI